MNEALWIWDNSGEHPRNYWVCFRKTLDLACLPDSAVLHITADARYVLYINGHELGHGPVRSWPFEISYDSYDLKDYLVQGLNVVAVLVTHYGISTSQYIEGRGGMLAQLNYEDQGKTIKIGTDNTWKTHAHDGYSRHSVRISNCLPWAEIFDASRFAPNWMTIKYDDCHWEYASVIGKPGMQPWPNMIKRDIPFLTKEAAFPRRVLSYKEVVPVRQNISIDMRNAVFPKEYDINNMKLFSGYLATIVISKRDMEGHISLNYDAHGGYQCVFKLNGIEYTIKNGEQVLINLRCGDNLLLIDPSGRHHDPTAHLAFDFKENVLFRAPLYEDDQFVFIGPFYKNTVVEIGYPIDVSIKKTDEYFRIWEIEDEKGLLAYKEWIKPIGREYLCTENVASMSVFKKVLRECELPCESQNMIMANNSFTLVKPFQSGDCEYILDFGSEFSGFLEIDVDASQGIIFDFFMFESMHDDRIEHTFTLNNTLRYKAMHGRQTYCSVIRRGFRYLAITVRNTPESVKIHSIKVYQSNYPVAEVGQFQCSDYLLNRIWEMSRDTTRLCMEDTFVDCPAYEQNFWVGDSRNQALISYYVFGEYCLVKRCLNLVSKSMRRSPVPESHVPSGWQNVLTAWALFWMTACKEYYFYSSDVTFLREIYPSLIQAAKGLTGFINQDGLLDISAWNMLDWAPMDIAESSVIAHQNALLVKSFRDVADIAKILGMAEDEKWLNSISDNVKSALNRVFWSDAEKAFFDSIKKNGNPSSIFSIQTNLMIYLCGCADEDRNPMIEKMLLKPPEHFVKIASPFVNFFYLEALTKMGSFDMVIEIVKEIWGNMLDHDAKTCWEGWRLIEGDYTRSHCHGWSAGPGYFFGAYILGVRPDAPGFSQVVIEPRPEKLKWVKGSVPTPEGIITVCLTQDENVIDIFVTLPSKMKAKLELKHLHGKQVNVNGRAAEMESLLLQGQVVSAQD